MNKLSFWYKVAFIANICALITWLLPYYEVIPRSELQSMVIITGLVTANIINFLVNMFAAFDLLRKKLAGKVPRWLLVINFVFLLFQLRFLFNDT